eukprot:scaffold7194_cov181-Ochromonas_danica.AAC.6
MTLKVFGTISWFRDLDISNFGVFVLVMCGALNQEHNQIIQSNELSDDDRVRVPVCCQYDEVKERYSSCDAHEDCLPIEGRNHSPFLLHLKGEKETNRCL